MTGFRVWGAAEDVAASFGGLGSDPRVPEAGPGGDAPFFQAGLAGYSDAAMRSVARRHGCPEPGPGHRPVRLHRRVPHAELGGGLGDRHPGENAQFDDARVALVQPRELVQTLAEVRGVDLRPRTDLTHVERDGPRPAAPLHRAPGARMVNEHVPHDVRRQREERLPVGRLGAPAHEPHPRLVHERRRLERRLVPAEDPACDRAQVVVERGEELPPGVGVGARVPLEERGDVEGGLAGHGFVRSGAARFTRARCSSRGCYRAPSRRRG